MPELHSPKTAVIENGFAEVGAGSWLVSPAQPVAFDGSLVRRRRKGWRLPDRSDLELVETSSRTFLSDAARPFLTYLTAAAPLATVSSKVLVAPSNARSGASFVRVVPMSVRGGVCTTEFSSDWVVMATRSRVKRIVVEDGGTLSVRPDAVVAWTGNRPTGFCPRLGLFDILLPRGPKDLLFHFHGPAVVWTEGATRPAMPRFRHPR